MGVLGVRGVVGHGGGGSSPNVLLSGSLNRVAIVLGASVVVRWQDGGGLGERKARILPEILYSLARVAGRPTSGLGSVCFITLNDRPFTSVEANSPAM